MTTPQIGQPLPAFKAESTHGAFDSQAMVGKPWILYFYPKDNTPGCTLEAQDFRDGHAAFDTLGCRIVGVSRDSIKSHEGFTSGQSLPFELISDPQETLCEQFGVMKLKNMYGKRVRGIERSTFLIDAQGVLAHEWRGVRVPGHVAEVLQAVKDLGA